MMNLRLSVLAFSIIAAGVGHAAMAQQMPGGSSLSNPNSLQPKAGAPDIAPPALPGAGAPGLQTAPVMQKPSSADPNTELFTAVNADDYNTAQDAISRGADLNARNALGETPLDLSIALNRNTITFLLLSARNEGGDNSGPVADGNMGPPPSPPVSHAAGLIQAKSYVLPHKINSVTVDDPGTPDPAAGFLGFGPKN